LHNSKTNWDTYRQIIQDKVNLSIKLKEHEYIEIETNNLLSLLQHVAKEATPNSDPQKTTNKLPYEIKRLVAEKRRSRSIWQRTHTPDSRRICNQTSKNLNPNSKKCGINPLKNTFLILKGKITLFG
jgi:hypothetical protein